jgi:DMSO/TMAO reductase YedYZ molybdopterin-dependent catalytic subunit
MSNAKLVEPVPRPLFKSVTLGAFAGLLAGVTMLCTMGFLRLFFGWPTPTELIFDRVFPLLTVNFFISSLVKAGGYTPLKLQGIYGALVGQLVVAAVGGVVYAIYLRRMNRTPGVPPTHRVVDPRGWSLIIPGVLGATALLVALLWPTLITNYRGLPPPTARVIAALEMLISFSVCGVGIIFFYGLLERPHPIAVGPDESTAPPVGLRRFLAVAIGATAAVFLTGILRRLFAIGTFQYDGTQYGGPQVQKLTPNDKFYQVSKNLVDPDVMRDSWRLDIVGQVENSRSWSFAEIAALPAVEQETTLLCISYGIGSGLCSNAVWKGVPLSTLLGQVKPTGDVTTILFRAADGYYETFRFEKAMEPTTLVAYEMNGAPLPQRHGFPLRLNRARTLRRKEPKVANANRALE